MKFLLLCFASLAAATHYIQPTQYLTIQLQTTSTLTFKVYPGLESVALFSLTSDAVYSFYYHNQSSLLCIERNRVESITLPSNPNQLHSLSLDKAFMLDSNALQQFRAETCQSDSIFEPGSYELHLEERDFTSQIKDHSIVLLGESQISEQTCITGYFYLEDACEPCQAGCAFCDSTTCFQQYDSTLIQEALTQESQASERSLQPTLECVSQCLECRDDYLCKSCKQNLILIYGGCFPPLEITEGLASFTEFDISAFKLQVDQIDTELSQFDETLKFPRTYFQIDNTTLQLRGASRFKVPYDHSFEPKYSVLLKVGTTGSQITSFYSVLSMTSLLPGCSRLLNSPNIKECTQCEPPYRKLGMLCFKSQISPQVGVADLTTFSLLPLKREIQRMNQQLILRDALPLREGDKFFSTELASYVVLFEDKELQTFRIPGKIANTFEFSVPLYVEIRRTGTYQSFVYDQVGLAQPPSLPPQELQTKINSSSSIPDSSQTPSNSTEPTNPSQSHPSPTNICGCSSDGTCDTLTRQCTCGSNKGAKCQYTPQVYEQLTGLLSQILTELKDLKPYLTPEDSLKYVNVLSSSLDLLSSDGYNTMLEMLWEVSGDPDHSQEVFGVLSKMAESPELTVQKDMRLLLDQEVQTISEYGEQKHVNTTSFNITVAPVIPNQPVIVNEGAFEIEPDVLPEGHVVVIQFNYNPYSGVGISQKQWATGVTSIEHFANGRTSEISNLSKPFTIRHRLNPQSDLKKWVDYANQSPQKKQHFLSQSPFMCSFWKEGEAQVASELKPESSQEGSFSTTGCKFVDFTTEELVCKCTHMTDFMGFFKTGLSVLQDSNYSVILAVTQLTWEGLKTNTGFLFTVGFFGSYILLVVLLTILDTQKLKKSFYEEMFRSLNQREVPSISTKRTLETNPVEYSFSTPRSSKSKSEDLNSHRSLTGTVAPNKRVSSIASISTIKVTPTRTSQIRKKFQKALKKRKSCCGKMASVTFTELKENNMPYNLVTTTSTLSPRAVRLTLFYLGIMIDVALCALFFNLEQEEDDPPFWDGIIQNFWVALYTVLIAMPPLVLVGCLLGFSGKTKKVLQDANNVNELAQAYRKHRRRIRCRQAFGFISFVLITSFLAIYIISFAHVATPIMARDWLESTMIGFMLDQVIFEVAPALVVALLALLSDCCNCKCSFILILAIEIYRIYRNLTDA